MTYLLNNFVNKLKYWMIFIACMLFFMWWISNANNDLLTNVFRPAYNSNTMIRISLDSDTAWRRILHWGSQVTLKKWEIESKPEPSLIVKLTRYFLKFTIAISVTMILYNGLSYIIQTGRWKEWKNLVSNVVYIVIWILIALFSVIIITILQSAWTTINETISLNQNNLENMSYNVV